MENFAAHRVLVRSPTAAFLVCVCVGGGGHSVVV